MRPQQLLTLVRRLLLALDGSCRVTACLFLVGSQQRPHAGPDLLDVSRAHLEPLVEPGDALLDAL
ncbi:hypothetical protein [Amycolatopsis sp. NPDC051102]|uniref:hypothetical protein n=1 Tax=Amycolatopsis sp. NPDC051102 TaxID=3155163 RepID=UPI003425FB35